jgi:HD-GYP domain-containing protein (c-di-GMP phosphodiesterase class II)
MASSAALPRRPSEDVQALGRELVRTLQVAYRTARTHGWNNEASLVAVDGLTAAVNATVAARGGFGLHVAGDLVYLDEARLRVDAAGYGFLEVLAGELTAQGIGSLLASGTVSAEQVREFLDVLYRAAGDPEEAAGRVNEELAETGSPFSVGPVREVQDLATGESEQIDKRERCKKAFFKALTVTQAMMKSAHLNQRLELRHAKRVVQNMVDLMMDEEFTFLGLTTLKAHDNYTFYHSVNVCIYSLALAKRTGMTRNQLAEVGVAALFHDLGKSKIPLAILRKTSAFTPEEWDVMRTHPEMGVKELVRMRGLSSLAFKSMMACFEHHLNYNESPGGYPRLTQPYRPHVIGRIVAIADCFDAMTTKRVYVKKATPRDKALSYMMSQAGTKFDPVLLRLFANMIGVFPVGTAVRLASGRLGVVTATPEDPNLCHRPRVLVITDDAGILRDGEPMDLWQRGPDGAYPDSILTAVDAESMGMDISKYFI